MHFSDLLGCMQGTCGAHGMTGCVHVCLCAFMFVCVHLSVWGREERKKENTWGCVGRQIVMCYDSGKSFMSGDSPDGYL